MSRAVFEPMTEETGFIGEIPGFQGVWSSGGTLDASRTELREVLEDWILIRVSMHLPLPVVDGIDLTVRSVA